LGFGITILAVLPALTPEPKDQRVQVARSKTAMRSAACNDRFMMEITHEIFRQTSAVTPGLSRYFADHGPPVPQRLILRDLYCCV